MKKVSAFCWALVILCSLSQFSATAQIIKNNKMAGIVSADCPVLKKNCSGKIVWEDGTTYEGAFRFGKPHGNGKITYKDGSKYTGEFVKGLPEGTGTCVYEDQSRYEGEWVNGIKYGEGVYYFPGGHQYSGSFENDVIHGQGTIKFSTGEKYTGDWKDGLADGNGTFTRRDRSQFIGMSKAGKREGEGMIVFQSRGLGNDTLKGFWENGLLVEDATYIFADGSRMISFWKNGQLKDEVFYVNAQQKSFWGTPEELAEKLLAEDKNTYGFVAQNFQLAFYGFAMEYQAMGNFELAEKNLDIAYQFIDPSKDSPFYRMASSLSVNLKIEKENINTFKLPFRF